MTAIDTIRALLPRGTAWQGDQLDQLLTGLSAELDRASARLSEVEAQIDPTRTTLDTWLRITGGAFGSWLGRYLSDEEIGPVVSMLLYREPLTEASLADLVALAPDSWGLSVSVSESGGTVTVHIEGDSALGVMIVMLILTQRVPVGSATIINTLALGSVSIAGGPMVAGATLTAVVEESSFPGASLSYQWTRDGIDISGATSDTYTLASADVGRTIGVDVTVTNVVGSLEKSGSAAPLLPEVANLLLRLENYVGVTTNGSDEVTEWADQETADGSQDATQSIAGEYPDHFGGDTPLYVGGLAANGLGWLALPALTSVAGPVTVFAVVEHSVASPGTEQTLGYWQGGDLQLRTGAKPQLVDGGSSVSGHAGLDASVRRAFAWRLSAPGAALYMDRDVGLGELPLAADRALDAGRLFNDDAGTTLDGQAYAVLVFDGALDADAMEGVWDYLAAKYAVSPAVSGLRWIIPPSWSGTAEKDETLTAVDGEARGDGAVSYTYQWTRNGSPISGATGATYTLTNDDVGKTIGLDVTAADAVTSVTVATRSAAVASVDLMTFVGGNPTSSPETVASGSIDSRFFSEGYDVTADGLDSTDTSGTKDIFRGASGDALFKTAIADRFRFERGGLATLINLSTSAGASDAIRFLVDFGADQVRIWVAGVEDAASPFAIAGSGGWAVADVDVGTGWPGDIYQPVAI